MFYKGWFWGKTFCIFIGAFKIINALAEVLSLGMIAVSKCIGLLKPELARKLFSGLPGKLFIALIWIHGHVFMIPIYFPKYFKVNFTENFTNAKTMLSLVMLSLFRNRRFMLDEMT